LTKSCPDSSYNGEWYFYEDISQLVPKWFSAEQEKKPELGKPEQVKPELGGLQKVFISFASPQRKGQVFNSLYPDMKKSLEQAYTTNQKVQDFDWNPLGDLTWTLKDEKGTEQQVVLKDILPSEEALTSLLTEIDICNAFATKLSLESPYQETVDQTGKHLSRAEWHALSQQLDAEIGKAEDQTDNIELDASKKLSDIAGEFSIPGTVNMQYTIEFQAKHDSYIALLHGILEDLKQSRILASQIKQLEINPFSFGP
jgi:hypothetical protein